MDVQARNRADREKMNLIMSSCYLDNPIYFKRTQKWLDYHLPKLKHAYVILIDNASHPTHIETLKNLYKSKKIGFQIRTRDEHYARNSHLDYRYLWEPIAQYGKALEYYNADKIIYMENDTFLLSNKAMDVIEATTGWASPWCNKHNFHETALQVITKDSLTYKDFMKEDPFRFNGKLEMELALKPYLTTIDLIGDRYSEYPKEIPKNSDYATQVGLGDKVEWNSK